MTRTLLASVAVAAAVLSAGAASAADYRVAFGDLDLSTAQGAARFDLRVRSQARSACLGDTPLAQARCRTAFREEAMARLPDLHRRDYARGRGDQAVVRGPSDVR